MFHILLRANCILRLKSLRVVLVGAVILLSTAMVNAGFIKGIETFDGKSVDSGSWPNRSRYGYGRISQDGALTVDGTEVMSRANRIDVGWSVRVDVTCLDTPASKNYGAGLVSLILASGESSGSWADSFAAMLEISLFADHGKGNITGWSSSLGHGIGRPMCDIADSAAAVGKKFSLQIDRLSTQEFRFSAFDCDNHLLSKWTMTASYDASRPLYVDLYTNGVSSATFDNVTIWAAPEPATLSLLALGGLVMMRRRKQGARASGG